MSDLSQFSYTTYIRTTPDMLWRALTEAEFTRQYWMGTWQDCQWKVGDSWKILFADGRVADCGKVLEVDSPRRLVLAWQNEFMPELKAEGFSRMSYDLEPMGDTVKLTVNHEMALPQSKFIKAVSNGWPIILSSLKSLLETGEALADAKMRPASQREK